MLKSITLLYFSGEKEPIGSYSNGIYRLSKNVTEIPDEIAAEATSVYITRTMITELKANVFAHLSKLFYLNLYENRISVIEPGAFNGLVKLNMLLLEKNRLESLEPGTFFGLSSLTHLRLDENELTTLELETFSGLSSLTYLSLTKNNLTTLDPIVLEDLPRPLDLDLSGNPLFCNGSLCWLQEEMRNETIRWFSFTCSNRIRWNTWKCHGK